MIQLPIVFFKILVLSTLVTLALPKKEERSGCLPDLVSSVAKPSPFVRVLNHFFTWVRERPAANSKTHEGQIPPETLIAALAPELALEGYDGVVNLGLWKFDHDGKTYFAKQVNAKSSNPVEFQNAQRIFQLGLGPQVSLFVSKSWETYLVQEYISGVNVKDVWFYKSGIRFADHRYLWKEIPLSLGLAPMKVYDANYWEFVTTKWIAAIKSNKESIIQQLIFIERTLIDDGFYNDVDFQFILHFENAGERIVLKVIDTSGFDRSDSAQKKVASLVRIQNFIKMFEAL